MKTQVHHLGFLFWLKWVISFIWPIRIVSDGKGTTYIELVLYQGKRLLNSSNANYSNGNLQVAYRSLFREVNLQLEKRTSALVLGFGLGGVSTLMNENNPKLKQVGVEVNATILKWYMAFCRPVPNLNLIQEDVMLFLDSQTDCYDVVIVDVYNDLDVPEELHRKEVLAKIQSFLSPNGVLVFNKIVGNDTQKDEADQLILDLSSMFKSVITNNQFDLNRFIICQNKT